MELITQHICQTFDIGVQSNLFGGRMMEWLDEAGAIYAMRKLGTKSIVTVKVDELVFKHAVHVHDLVEIEGEVVALGETSITLHLKADRVNPDTDFVNRVGRETVCETNMVFVHIGEDGHSKKHGVLMA